MMDLKQARSRRAAIHTVGCRLNQSESAVLTARLKAMGYELVEYGQSTDLLIVNTCSVTENAEADCRYAVRKTLRHSPHAFIAVTGCYAQTGLQALQSIPGISLILGNQYKMDLPDYLEALGPQTISHQLPQIVHTRSMDRDDFCLEGVGDYQTTRANLKIQDGCNFMCAFCLIPFARGRERSRQWENAFQEAEALVARGHQELVLTGVNIGQFQNRGMTLLEFIQRLETIDGLKRIRISSIEPTTIPDELLAYMASSPKLCRYLHIPLQSGDDSILKAMNRRYTAGEYQAWVEHALDAVPQLCLGTDVMVGFPGEGDREFAHTRRMLERLPFAYCHVFTYSERPGTAASRLPHRVSSAERKQRNRELTRLSHEKRQQFYRRFVGETVSVLFETQTSPGVWTGLTDNFIKVGVPVSGEWSNTIHDVVITGWTDEFALGQMRKRDSGSSNKPVFILQTPKIEHQEVSEGMVACGPMGSSSSE